MQDRADRLAHEALDIHEKRRIITKLSNLALQLYSWYIKNGHVRNEKDETGINEFFKENLPEEAHQQTGFYERLYLYQSYCWYAFIRQDFLMYYRYTQKWTDLFEEQSQMKQLETGHYIKGMHNLLNAHFDLRNFKKFDETIQRFEEFTQSEIVQQNDNNKIQTFVYLNTAKLNRHFMFGTFGEGIQLVPYIEEMLDEYAIYLDRHRILVFYYKIASLYFGNADYDKCIDYVQKIINWNVDLRNDLQCYARLLHLLSHYELGNLELMETLTKSVYRFMSKMENLTIIEEEMFKFLRNSFHTSPRSLRPEFEKLFNKIKCYEKNRYQTRSFAYLDILSWLESKLYNQSLSFIIHKKYKENKRQLMVKYN
jgi:hypothetical protein